MLKAEKRIPWHKIAILFAILAILAVHALLLGGPLLPSLSFFYILFFMFFYQGRAKSIAGLIKCTWEYWLAYFSIFPIMLIITILIGRYLLNLALTRQSNSYSFLSHLDFCNVSFLEIEYEYVHGDIKWSPKSAAIISSASVFAGLLGSLVGIGGGMVPSLLTLTVTSLVDDLSQPSMLFPLPSSPSLLLLPFHILIFSRRSPTLLCSNSK